MIDESSTLYSKIEIDCLAQVLKASYPGGTDVPIYCNLDIILNIASSSFDLVLENESIN